MTIFIGLVLHFYKIYLSLPTYLNIEKFIRNELSDKT